MKKIVYLVLLLLILGGAGFFIYSRNKSKNTPTREYGILNPNPNTNQQYIYQPDSQSTNPNSQSSNSQSSSSQPTSPQQPAAVTHTTETKPRGQVLGETKAKTKPKAPVYASKPKAVTPAAAVSSGLSVYKISELGFQISVPSSWLPRLEEAGGNVVAFYNSSGGQLGQIEVLVGAQESFDSLIQEVQANPNVSNIRRTSVNGLPALIFQDQRFGGGEVIALTHNDNVYYLRGAFIQPAHLQNFKLLN